jgi:transposase
LREYERFFSFLFLMKKILSKTFSVPDSLIIDELWKTDDGDTILECHTKKKRIECPHCGGKTRKYDFTLNKKRHTVVSGKTVWLHIRKRRIQCKKCKKVFTETVEGISRAHLTNHMVQQVQEKVRGQDYTRVANEFGIGIATVSRKVSELPLADFLLPKKKTSSSA